MSNGEGSTSDKRTSLTVEQIDKLLNDSTADAAMHEGMATIDCVYLGMLCELAKSALSAEQERFTGDDQLLSDLDSAFITDDLAPQALKDLCRRASASLADANYWRARHCRESEAAGKQSHEHWQKWKDAEARLVWLQTLFEHCPHAGLTYNADDDGMDGPQGFTLIVEGCSRLELHAPTLWALIDLGINAKPDEDGDVVESASPSSEVTPAMDAALNRALMRSVTPVSHAATPERQVIQPPFQKALTVVMTKDDGDKQADADLTAIKGDSGTVFRVGVSSLYFHQLRLRAAVDPSLLDKIAVFYLRPDDSVLQECGLRAEDERRWPVGFEHDIWVKETEIARVRHQRETGTPIAASATRRNDGN